MQNSAAFFDVDETLINIKSMFNFYEFWCLQRGETERFDTYMMHFRDEVKNGTPREHLNREYYRQFSGVSYSGLIEAGEIWFSKILQPCLFIENAISALKRHQLQGTQIVFISGSMQPVLLPIARYFNVEDMLCAPLIIGSSGRVTGEIGQPQTIGAGKKSALLTFCKERNINPADCYAYGDDLSDIAMLESTGHPVCVGTETSLARHAKNNGWTII